MARSLRVEYAGAHYHVMARGNRREAIFLDEEDRRFFLGALEENCGRTGWLLHAWVLMGNHYHLFVQTPEPNLVEGMKWLQNTYTRRFNVRHRAWGRLFGDRYKAIVTDGEDPDYYLTLMNYIHLNPARAGLVRVPDGGSVLDYPWSSVAGGYALAPSRRPRWLAAAQGMEMQGLPDTVAGRRRMVERLDRRALEEKQKAGVDLPAPEADARTSHLRRGWYWGSQAFAEKLRAMLAPRVDKPRSRAYRRTPQRLAHGEAQAEALIAGGLTVAGLNKGDLSGLKGSDPRKVALARLVRTRTTVDFEWIARRLHMRSAANASQAVRTRNWRNLRSKLPRDLRRYVEERMNLPK